VGDTVLPNANAGLAYRWFMTVGYPRVKEIIEQDLGSGLIYVNSHAADLRIRKFGPTSTNTSAARMAMMQSIGSR
jgi:4-hydroxyphenylacetate 3-monooxygenase